MVIKSQRGENEQILVSFSDTGIGLPPHLAEQIFDPFFTTKPHGTGMGLRISRSIAESHGGRLWAVGSDGLGATFHLSLPAGVPAIDESACVFRTGLSSPPLALWRLSLRLRSCSARTRARR
jgi:signal transduction histidine kinase